VPSANGAQVNKPAPIAAIGSAVILGFDYLTDVYAVHEIGPGDVCLSGAKEPPAQKFDILLHTADGFAEYTASVQQQTGANRWSLALEGLAKPKFLQQPARRLGHPDSLPIKRKIG
jgi:hypothetical protein